MSDTEHPNKALEMAKLRINGMRMDFSLKSLLELLVLLIDEVRVQNDTVPKDELGANQGEIRAYQKLIDLLARPLPNVSPGKRILE